jgi:hypothetical protein
MSENITLKEIIEKLKILKDAVNNSSLLNQGFVNGYNEACKDVLPDLEKVNEYFYLAGDIYLLRMVK